MPHQRIALVSRSHQSLESALRRIAELDQPVAPELVIAETDDVACLRRRALREKTAERSFLRVVDITMRELVAAQRFAQAVRRKAQHAHAVQRLLRPLARAARHHGDNL
jgi:hypothetical protein